jgi:hypothetical protein
VGEGEIKDIERSSCLVFIFTILLHVLMFVYTSLRDPQDHFESHLMDIIVYHPQEIVPLLEGCGAGLNQLTC